MGLVTVYPSRSMPDFARQRTESPDLVPILESWAISSVREEWPKGASDSDIAQAERAVGRNFPPAFRGLYQVSDGISVLEGNLNFHPLRPTEKGLGVTDASTMLREWRWPIPQELLVFGDNGADEVFGLWLPSGNTEPAPHPVVEVGEIFHKPEAFAVVGTDLCRFLRTWTAFYTLMNVHEETAEPEALDVLGVPAGLREDMDDETLFGALSAWADPSLPDPHPDPYKRGRRADALQREYGASARV